MLFYFELNINIGSVITRTMNTLLSQLSLNNLL